MVIRCLKAIRVTLCPLCRIPYEPLRIKKLHVDKYTGDGYDSLAKDETKILRATVVGFEEGVSEQVINELLIAAEGWLFEGEETRTVSLSILIIWSQAQNLVTDRGGAERGTADRHSGLAQI